MKFLKYYPLWILLSIISFSSYGQFTVTNTNDAGAGSLRQAIINANASAAKETITFNISGAGPWQIDLQSTITIDNSNNVGMVIDGLTQPTSVFGTNNMVVLDGTAFAGTSLSIAEPNVEIYGLHITNFTNGLTSTTGSTGLIIGAAGRGNVISGNSAEGINIDGSTNAIIQGNRIGTSADGLTANGNQAYGIQARFADNLLIGGNRLVGEGNLISGNGTANHYAIHLRDGTDAQVFGNLIGTDANGNNNLGNRGGITVTSGCDNPTIGGTGPGQANVVAGCSGNPAILVSGSAGPANQNVVIENNVIGLNASGTIAIPNFSQGISLRSVNGVSAGDIIRGNTIAASGSTGLEIIGFSQTNIIIENNKIGTDVNGNGGAVFGINSAGMSLSNVIGTDNTANRVQILDNIIANSLLNGLSIASLDNALIQRNYIGVEQDGITPGPNTGAGIFTGGGSVNLEIGGIGNENIIAYNTGDGITFQSLAQTTAGTVIGVNSYFCNGDEAIDFTLVPAVDLPVITSVTVSDIDGTSTASDGSTIDIYVINTGCADNQGATYVGQTTVTSGLWNYNSVIDDTQTYVATVTDVTNGISEFSAAFTSSIFTVINTNDSGVGSLRYCITNANTITGVNTIIFNIPNTDPNYALDGGTGNETWTIYPITDLPAITQGVVLDGTTQPGTGNYKIKIDGQGTRNRGFNVTGGFVEVYGFYLTGFNANGSSAAISIIHLGGSPSTIGAVNKGNVINSSRNGITFSLRAGCTIKGNLIGTDETGEIDLGNSVGIELATNGSAQIIGGDLAGEGNLISGNNIGIRANASGGHSIRGNYIGTNMDGTSALGNTDGISFGTSGNNSFINNLISGNSGNAINLVNSANNTFQGNTIGEGSDGSPMGNDRGIEGFNTQGNTIGGILAGQGNTIVNSTNEGIFFTNAGCVNNVIIGNTINCNGIGIDLSGVANNNIQPPVITSVTLTSVSGTGIDGDEIHVYRDNSACTPLQGEEYLGTTTVAGGTWTLGALSLGASDKITATATNATDGTSEFTTIIPAPFITTWKTDNPGTSGSNQITIPTNGVSVYNYDVVWGDGMSDTGVIGDITHTYATPGTYTVSISGTFPAIRFNNGGDREKLLTVEQWGDNAWASMQDAFYGCTNLTVPALDTPNLSVCITMAQMFRGATSFNSPIGSWDLGSSFATNGMFQGASSFNQNISAWDVTGISNMSFMFTDAIAFNQPLTWTTTGNITDISGMFRGATNFNQDLSSWDVSSVLRMQQMFQSATSFNGNIDTWNVSNVQFMSNMFRGASSFNRNIGTWTTSSLTSVVSMFQDASSFNQNISGWDVSGVTSMLNMFLNASSFNQPLTWDASLSNVTNMSGMFFGAAAFDQDVSNWDVSNVNDMSAMFGGALSFNQSLENWDIGNVTTMAGMLNNTALSIANYDATLIGWESLPSLQNSVDLDANGLTYCAGESARAALIAANLWVISGDSKSCIPEIAVFESATTGGVEIFNNQLTPFDLGSSSQGNDLTMQFTIENQGGADLNISDISISGTLYSILSSTSFIIPAGNTEIIDVLLDASSMGTFDETVTITSDDADESLFEFPITGTITMGVCSTLPTVNAGSNQTFCAGSSIPLIGTIGGGAATSTWTTSGTGTLDDTMILNATYFPSAVDETNGSITLTLTVPASGFCPEVTDDLVLTIAQPISASNPTVASSVQQLSTIDVLAGSSANPGDVLTLSILQDGTKGTGIVNSDNTLGYTPNAGTVGSDTFTYRICNQCSSCSDGTVTIDITNEAPLFTAPPSNPTVVAGQSITISLLNIVTDLNDNIDLTSFTNFSSSSNVAFTYDNVTGSLVLNYANATINGTVDNISFTICDQLNLCVDVTLQIEVDGEIRVYNGISPNGDGLNDYFNINNIQFLEPNNKVSIFNRWGDKVYEVNGYDPSDTSKRFEGRQTNGKELPNGVYFYKVEFPGDKPSLSGYLTLKK